MNGTQPYKDVHRADDHEELLSATDVESSPVDERKQWSSAGLREARWSSSERSALSILREYWWLITTFMLGVIIILQLIIWNETSSRSSSNAPQVGGDFLGKGPTCS